MISINYIFIYYAGIEYINYAEITATLQLKTCAILLLKYSYHFLTKYLYKNRYNINKKVKQGKEIQRFEDIQNKLNITWEMNINKKRG